MKVYLAVDLGAGSGRVMAGKTDFSEGHDTPGHDILELEELHRFDNNGAEVPGGYYWDILGLYKNIVKGIRAGIDKYGDSVQSVGIDTWGCDYGLLSKNGSLLGIPHQYRDPRSNGMAELAEAKLGQAKIYASTGIMTAFYNTSLHLLAQVESESTALHKADQILFTPDLLAYWLTGEKANERTIAGRVVEPGTILGNIREGLSQQIGTDKLPVVSAPSHDTASAVAGIPIGSSTDDKDSQDIWISSGTWSIMGIEADKPNKSPEAMAAGYANELGVEGSVRFLKNISGLWIIQECKRYWADQGNDYDYGALAELATEAEAFSGFIDPDDTVFASPGDMPEKIMQFCKDSGQDVPDSKGSILRIASESIAMKYRVVCDQLAGLSEKPLGKVYMGGGGIQNQMLTQNTADALGREVIAGPIEATSCGNIISQMVATGHLANITEGRELVRRSQQIKTYLPESKDAWDAELDRFKSILTT